MTVIDLASRSPQVRLRQSMQRCAHMSLFSELLGAAKHARANAVRFEYDRVPGRLSMRYDGNRIGRFACLVAQFDDPDFFTPNGKRKLGLDLLAVLNPLRKVEIRWKGRRFDIEHRFNMGLVLVDSIEDPNAAAGTQITLWGIKDMYLLDALDSQLLTCTIPVFWNGERMECSLREPLSLT